MKLALLTLISCCLIALSWQQQYQYRQLAANPYWPEPLNNHRGSQPFYYYYDQAPQSNHPYYRGPYYSTSAMSYGSYPNSYQQRHQLAALLSQLNLMKDFSTQETIDNDQVNYLKCRFNYASSTIQASPIDWVITRVVICRQNLEVGIPTLCHEFRLVIK